MEQVIQIFNENDIKYLVIGGQAVRLYGMPRFSMDWDIYIPGKDKIKKINRKSCKSSQIKSLCTITLCSNRFLH